MNIAICFTGQCRSLEHTYESIDRKILQPLKKYADRVDVFAYIAENENSHKFKDFFKEYASLKIEPDRPIDTSFIVKHDQRGMQGYMQMLNGYYEVNKMREEFEAKNNITYDAVIRARLDVEFVDEIDYSFDDSLKAKFISSISDYWPDINPSKLHPDYTGIRPKITRPNESMRDFSIQTFYDHGIKNFINLQGIESPGLTSSLAIGKLVKNLL